MLFDDLSLSLEKTIRTVPHLSIYSRLVDMMPRFQTCFRAFFRQNFAHWGRSIRYLGMNFGIAMVSVVSVVSVVVEIPRHFGQSMTFGLWTLVLLWRSCQAGFCFLMGLCRKSTTPLSTTSPGLFPALVSRMSWLTTTTLFAFGKLSKTRGESCGF